MLKVSLRYIIPLIIILICTLGAAGIFVLGRTEQPKPMSVDDTLIPQGWYQHPLGEHLVIITKDKQLPRIGATELYAFGEQILVNITPNNEETRQSMSWIDDPQSGVTKREVLIAGIPSILIEGEAGGASGQEKTYFLMTDDMIYILSLYPSEKPELQALFEMFVENYAKTL